MLSLLILTATFLQVCLNASLQSISPEMLLRILAAGNYESIPALASTSMYFQDWVHSESLHQISLWAGPKEEGRILPSASALKVMILPALACLADPETDVNLVMSVLPKAVLAWYQFKDFKAICDRITVFPKNIKTKLIEHDWKTRTVHRSNIGYLNIHLLGYEGFSAIFDDFFFGFRQVSNGRHLPQREKQARLASEQAQKREFMSSIYESHQGFFLKKQQELLDLVGLLSQNKMFMKSHEMLSGTFKDLTGHEFSTAIRVPTVEELKVKFEAPSEDYLWKLMFYLLMDGLNHNLLQELKSSWQKVDPEIALKMEGVCTFFNDFSKANPFDLSGWSHKRINDFASVLKINLRDANRVPNTLIDKILAANTENSQRLLTILLQAERVEEHCFDRIGELMFSISPFDVQCIFHHLTVPAIELVLKVQPDEHLTGIIKRDLNRILEGDEDTTKMYQMNLEKSKIISMAILMTIQDDANLLANLERFIEILPILKLLLW